MFYVLPRRTPDRAGSLFYSSFMVWEGEMRRRKEREKWESCVKVRPPTLIPDLRNIVNKKPEFENKARLHTLYARIVYL